MSRLIDPGLGDYLDRLTILHLKLRYGGLSGKPTAHFSKEADVIETKISLRTSVKPGEVAELAAVNAALWEAEDTLRRLRTSADVAPIAAVAIRIQTLNDARAGVIEAINRSAGDFTGAEKC